MTIEREEGRDGPITFVCDVCGEHKKFCENFQRAWSDAKHEGWMIRQIGDEWCHYCCYECFKD